MLLRKLIVTYFILFFEPFVTHAWVPTQIFIISAIQYYRVYNLSLNKTFDT